MKIEIPDKIYRPCSTCSDDTCVFHGDKNTHEICTNYKDKRLAKAIEEIRDLPFVSTKTKYVDGVKVKGEHIETIYRDDVLEILERCLGE